MKQFQFLITFGKYFPTNNDKSSARLIGSILAFLDVATSQGRFTDRRPQFWWI